ncbi:MAG: hypothetical protein GY796_20080 [Chloroflexi bacterium]|nr:hypothetical protein [Chloroflexota bacterium]
MSEALEQVVDRAAKDETFRQLLFKNPDEALKNYNVTDKERQMLADLNEDTFDTFAGTLGGRSTKGFLPGTG